eukprot:6929162-Ditylum_brightwellii.AAC.1
MVYGSKHASEIDDALTDEDVVRECLDVLRKICGKKDIPKPVDYVVTRWGKEKFSRGAFSYVPPGVKGMVEYGIMGQPIYDPLYDDDHHHSDNNDESLANLSEDKHDTTNTHKKESALHTATTDTNFTIKKERSAAEEEKDTSDTNCSTQCRRPLIMFAGEATTPYHPSTIHGAYLS